MTFEPNTIEPGYLPRWAKEALQLWRSNFTLWVLVAVVPMVPTFFFGESVLATVALAFLGVFAVNASFEMALTAEHGAVQVRQVPLILKSAFDGAIEEVWRRRVFMTGVLLVGLAFGLLMRALPAPEAAPRAPVTLDWVDYLFTPSSPLFSTAALLYFGFVGMRFGQSLGYLFYPLMRMHGLDPEVVEPLLLKAKRKNFKAVMALDLLASLVPMLTFLFCPPLALPLTCFLPAFAYVACREAFGPGGPLNVVEEMTPQLTVAGAQG